MNITVRFFASLRDATGTHQCTLDVVPGARLEDMIERLLQEYPALAEHQTSWHFAVNQVHAEADTVLQDGDRVAVFPYVAGG